MPPESLVDAEKNNHLKGMGLVVEYIMVFLFKENFVLFI